VLVTVCVRRPMPGHSVILELALDAIQRDLRIDPLEIREPRQMVREIVRVPRAGGSLCGRSSSEHLARVFSRHLRRLVQASIERGGPHQALSRVSYHRIGYAGSSRVAVPVSITQQAAHLRSLLRQLRIERAHIVGHSSGGNIALQLALDAHEMVHSLVIMEPALPVTASGSERLLSTRSALAPAVDAFRAGDKARAIDLFMRGVAGPDYRGTLEQALPGAFSQAIVDADTFFGQELPSVQQWSLEREDASRISQPVLAVIGGRSKLVSPIWSQRQEMLLTWLPNAEDFVLGGATHLLHVQDPRGVAEGLAAFFARHPLRVRSDS
jgi:pimeloyl-ACP methyl ester carboxylesterase